MSKRPRAGVIEVGAMGKNRARLYCELPIVELTGIADALAFSDYNKSFGVE